ncbi:hypothetical protein FQN50_008948 [Emmonsiellopsis sp. PD_5]|nr:hypothetical protein FQN50_008948 [Emmonsiellopsis sp. PD_5]
MDSSQPTKPPSFAQPRPTRHNSFKIQKAQKARGKGGNILRRNSQHLPRKLWLQQHNGEEEMLWERKKEEEREVNNLSPPAPQAGGNHNPKPESPIVAKEARESGSDPDRIFGTAIRDLGPASSALLMNTLTATQFSALQAQKPSVQAKSLQVYSMPPPSINHDKLYGQMDLQNEQEMRASGDQSLQVYQMQSTMLNQQQQRQRALKDAYINDPMKRDTPKVPQTGLSDSFTVGRGVGEETKGHEEQDSSDNKPHLFIRKTISEDHSKGLDADRLKKLRIMMNMDTQGKAQLLPRLSRRLNSDQPSARLSPTH